MASRKHTIIKKITARGRQRISRAAAVLYKGENVSSTSSPKRATTEGYAEDVAMIVRHTAETTAREVERLSDQSFQLLMTRFDTLEDQNKTLEDQNKEQNKLLAEHATLDQKVHDIVIRHEGYFSIAKWLIGPTGIGIGLAAWFGFHK